MQQNYIKQLLMLLAFIPITWLPVHATDYMNVYLTSQGSFQSIDIDEIDKITFPSEDEVNIIISAIVTSMAINNIEVITFGDTDITSIEEAVAEIADVEIIYYGGEVRITSPEIITQVQLYNIQGEFLQTLTPGVETATLEVGNCPTGIYIVAVQSKGEIVTKKIIIN
ncbi:MAG: T9SS type A sorting domain-containing protein [Bacteroidales bacterium]|nr:T9SS type A sorting domain-containing protein [Bacteroidales bacterium]